MKIRFEFGFRRFGFRISGIRVGIVTDVVIGFIRLHVFTVFLWRGSDRCRCGFLAVIDAIVRANQQHQFLNVP